MRYLRSLWRGPLFLLVAVPLLALPGTHARGDAADDEYHVAAGLYQQKIYSHAAEKLKAFLQANPKHAQAKIAAYQLGSSLYNAANDAGETDYPAAVAAYEKTIVQYPDAALAALARYDLGDAYFRLGRYEKSIAAYASFLTSKPTAEQAARALYDTGDAYDELGKSVEARATYKKLLTAYPQSDFSANAHYSLGRLALQAKQTDEAINAFKTVVEKYSESEIAARARLGLAHSYLEAGKAAEARPLYRALLDDADLKSEAQIGLAAADWGAADWKAAAASYEAALPTADATQRPFLQRQLAAALFKDKQYERAVTAYAPLLNEPASAPLALYWSGEAKVALKNYDEAAAQYQRLTTEYSGHELAASAALRLAQIAYEKQAWPDVQKWAQWTLDHKPNAETAENAIYHLALAKAANQDAHGAIAAYREQLKAHPKGAQAKNAQRNLAVALYSAKQWTEAAPELRKALGMLEVNDAERGVLQFELASALYQTGKFKDAADAFGAVKSQPADAPDLAARAALWQGLSLLKLPDGAKTQGATALAAFEKSIAAAPQSEAAAKVAAEALYQSALLADALKYPDAATRWQKLARDFPNHARAADALLQQADALFDAKKWAEAATAYRGITDKNPSPDTAAPAWYQLGATLYYQEKWDEAAAAFETAAGYETSPDALAASFWAGDSLARGGKIGEASKYFQAFLTGAEALPATEQATPDMKAMLAKARFGIGQTLAAANNWDGAVAAYRAVAADMPATMKTEWHYRLGEALAAQNQTKAAKDEFLKITSDAQWGSRALWQAAQLSEKAGDTTGARELYTALAAREPADEWSRQAAEKMKDAG